MEDLKLIEPDSPLARALQRGRERYNGRVAAARRQGRRLDSDTLGVFLAEDVAPLLAAVDRVASARTDAVLEDLFDLALDLLPREIVGSMRHPSVVHAWRFLLPKLARRVADEPRRVVASVTNAVLHLEQEPCAHPDTWLAAMATLGPGCETVDLLLTLGQVLAWRSGLAHYRESALEAWDRLPDSLASVALGISSAAGPATRERLRALLEHPWYAPGAPPEPASLRVVARVGDFRGFGGTFMDPPRVWAARDRIWAADSQRAFSLHADHFGQTLRPAPESPAEERPGGLARLESNGQIQFEGLTAKLPALAGATGFAVAGHTVAVTLSHSHRILLVARIGDTA